jgi:excisionase family DNA binding protein
MPKAFISPARTEANSSNGRRTSTRPHRGSEPATTRSVAATTNFSTIADIADRLDVSPRTVRRWIERGDLVVHRLGGVVRIAESDLRAFLAAHRSAEP